MDREILLSIVVPTKDRYNYLKYLIQLVDNLKSKDVELVIQDNSSDNADFLAYLSDMKYDFIKYNHISKQIPMSENADLAILNSTGEYVCFLGDDDGFTSYLLDGVRWMKQNSIEAVKPADVYYFWPDASQGQICNESSVLHYHPFTGRVKYISAYKELKKVLDLGIPNRGNMPLVYHSVVKRSVLDQVYRIGNTFFPGNSPDIANAVALSFVVKKFALVDLPWSYSGCSAFKGGGVAAPGKQYPPMIKDIIWFRANAEFHWDKRLPPVGIGSLIWAESTISALKYMQQYDLIEALDFNKIYCNFLTSNPSLKNMVFDVCESKSFFYIKYYQFTLLRFFNALLRRIGWKLGVISKVQKATSLQTIVDASKKLEELSNGLIIH